MKWSDCIPRSDQPFIELSHFAAKLRNAKSKIQVMNGMNLRLTSKYITYGLFGHPHSINVYYEQPPTLYAYLFTHFIKSMLCTGGSSWCLRIAPEIKAICDESYLVMKVF